MPAIPSRYAESIGKAQISPSQWILAHRHHGVQLEVLSAIGARAEKPSDPAGR